MFCLLFIIVFLKVRKQKKSCKTNPRHLNIPTNNKRSVIWRSNPTPRERKVKMWTASYCRIITSMTLHKLRIRIIHHRRWSIRPWTLASRYSRKEWVSTCTAEGLGILWTRRNGRKRGKLINPCSTAVGLSQSHNWKSNQCNNQIITWKCNSKPQNPPHWTDQNPISKRSNIRKTIRNNNCPLRRCSMRKRQSNSQ